MEKHTYENKKVYIGLDVHKKTYALTARCEGVTVKKATLSADPKALVTFLKKYFPGAQIFSAYEAGFCGFSLHRYLSERGIKNSVVNPASIETAARERVKTDKRDSLKIAIQLEAGRLRGIHVPSLKQELRRELTRYRESLVKKKRTFSNQIKSLFQRYGIKVRDAVVSRKWLQEVQQIKLPDELRFILDEQIESWIALDDKIKKVEEGLAQQAKSVGRVHDIYESLPGVGVNTARLLNNELGDMSQFENARKLYSFTGLTPREYSSGEHIRLGHISRQGRGILRRALVQSAWVAIRYDVQLRELFERLGRRIGKKKAIIAIARRIIGRIRACLKRDALYERVSREGELMPSSS